jgi:hypothetical protein
MARAKITGLGKAKGNVGGEMHLDDGDYLVEVVSAVWGESANGDPLLKTKFTVLDGPEQNDGREVQGMPWFNNNVIIEGHEYYDLFVEKLKNMVNALGVAVRQDSFNEDDMVGKRCVMRVKNKTDKKSGEMRSEIREFFDTEDKKSQWAGSGTKEKKAS